MDPHPCEQDELPAITNFDFISNCAVPSAPPGILGSPPNQLLDPVPPLPTPGTGPPGPTGEPGADGGPGPPGADGGACTPCPCPTVTGEVIVYADESLSHLTITPNSTRAPIYADGEGSASSQSSIGYYNECNYDFDFRLGLQSIIDSLPPTQFTQLVNYVTSICLRRTKIKLSVVKDLGTGYVTDVKLDGTALDDIGVDVVVEITGTATKESALLTAGTPVAAAGCVELTEEDCCSSESVCPECECPGLLNDTVAEGIVGWGPPTAAPKVIEGIYSIDTFVGQLSGVGDMDGDGNPNVEHNLTINWVFCPEAATEYTVDLSGFVFSDFITLREWAPYGYLNTSTLRVIEGCDPFATPVAEDHQSAGNAGDPEPSLTSMSVTVPAGEACRPVIIRLVMWFYMDGNEAILPCPAVQFNMAIAAVP